MANEGRYLNKRMVPAEGIRAGGQADAAIVEESGVWSMVGGARLGATAGPIVHVASVLASIDVAAIQPVGSTGAQAVDVALTGVAVGDLCTASPVASVPLGIVWAAACYSAGAVNIRVTHTQSGNLDLAATDWRVMAIRFG